MLAIQHAPDGSARTTRTTPHLLPAHIRHDGPITTGGKRYWNPQPDDDHHSTSNTAPPTSTDTTISPTTTPPSRPIQAAYFRGRKLLGRTLELPAGYQGHVLHDTQTAWTGTASGEATASSGGEGGAVSDAASLAVLLQQEAGNDEASEDDDEDDDGEEDPYRRMLLRQKRKAEGQPAREDEREKVTVLRSQQTFSEFVVWGHESVAADDDPYVRGVNEWIKFAETIHREEEEGEE